MMHLTYVHEAKIRAHEQAGGPGVMRPDMEGRCERCRAIVDIGDDPPRIESRGSQVVDGVSCSLVVFGRVCGGRIQPRDCQVHPYGSHDDYWNGNDCVFAARRRAAERKNE